MRSALYKTYLNKQEEKRLLELQDRFDINSLSKTLKKVLNDYYDMTKRI